MGSNEQVADEWVDKTDWWVAELKEASWKKAPP